MKKWISIILLIAVLVSLCACATNGEQAAGEPAATPAPDSPEAMFGHINELEKIDGVYKIWSPEGVKHMLENPGESFEMLCDVDMKGATVAPIQEFTGTINGATCYIKNFTVQGGDERIHFVQEGVVIFVQLRRALQAELEQSDDSEKATALAQKKATELVNSARASSEFVFEQLEKAKKASEK